ncbi:helicase HerA domain-containing protein [Cetobacterium sp.]|uniref:ATP-binding protein n=1 Tax=Cetobacterium sp. TaxID=2071632 RepID=UPI003F32D8F3
MKYNVEKLLNNSVSFLEKGYLSKKENFEIVKIQNGLDDLSFSTGIRMLHLTKFTYAEKENILDKLANVFTALYGNNTSLFLILDSNGETCNFYLGVRDEKAISQSFSTLKASLNGNFPGVEFDEDISTDKVESLMKDILKDDVMEISTVTGIPSLKSEDKDNFLQGIEKVVDGMEGKSFSAMFLAIPIDYENIKEIKRGYENLYNELYPFVDLTVSLNRSEAISLSKSTGETFTKSYSRNLSKTDSTNRNFTNGNNNSETSGYSTNFGLLGGVVGGAIGLLAGPVGAALGAGIGSLLGSTNKSYTSGQNNSETNGTSTSDTFGETYTDSKSYQKNLSDTKTDTIGKTLQMNQKNKILENIVDRIEQHLERIELSEGSGLWNVGTYFLSENPQNSVIAANIYNGIIRGKVSAVERNLVCTFDKYRDLEDLKDYLYNFANPVLKIKDLDIFTSVGSLVTNDELALKLNLPQKSVSGLDVFKMASFGRNKQSKSKVKHLRIGNLYHLGKTSNTEVDLDIESLASHSFITGSTGSGKSNAVYSILDRLIQNNIKFLAIEPAKGEYKNIFGGREDVNVYGTNSKYTNLLQINPFSFNEEIHILEHIDRLTEIFNACWPMYAAMPAIFKDAIEKAYIMVGWDLKESENLYGDRKFPTLGQLKSSLVHVINKSSYSEEIKNNYIGALVTRVGSLENGVIGNIFSENELEEKNLFDENVIVDISRIPSLETKSLVMGMLFMKLHEYRMSNHYDDNQKLHHVTILEEAHNLLKRTSTEVSEEGANIAGKSVEMITNAIAEMRTYGEGFIIVDQAPGLLDLSVIRNTNTKICFRLPSLEDREIVGKSMNLNEDQIDELSKLETGVSAVIQSNWKEACLVKFDYMISKNGYIHKYEKKDKSETKNLLKILLEKKLPPKERFEGAVDRTNIRVLNDVELDRFIFKTLDGDKILEIVNAVKSSDIEEWNNKIQNVLKNILSLNEDEVFFGIEITNSILRENTFRNPEYLSFYKEWNLFLRDGRFV